jgi:hypothetical protein
MSLFGTLDFKPIGEAAVKINADTQLQIENIVKGVIGIADDGFYNLQCFIVQVISTAQIGITVGGLITIIYVLLFPEQIFPTANKILDILDRLKPNIKFSAL